MVAAPAHSGASPHFFTPMGTTNFSWRSGAFIQRCWLPQVGDARERRDDALLSSTGAFGAQATRCQAGLAWQSPRVQGLQLTSYGVAVGDW